MSFFTPCPSPCVQVCAMRFGNQDLSVQNICEGCGRTLLEIAQWQQLSEPEKWRIVHALHARLSPTTP